MSDAHEMAAVVEVADGLVGGRCYDPKALGIGRADDGRPILILPTAEGILTLKVERLGDPPPGYTKDPGEWVS